MQHLVHLRVNCPEVTNARRAGERLRRLGEVVERDANGAGRGVRSKRACVHVAVEADGGDGEP